MMCPRFSKCPAMAVASVATLLLTAVLFLFAFLGWPSLGSEIQENCYEDYLTNPECFCERLRGNQPGDVMFAQPVNTLSNGFYVIVGLLIAYITDTEKYPQNSWWKSPQRSLFARQKLYPITYSTSVSLVGPASAFLHGSFWKWGSYLDFFSMMNVAVFLNIYGLVRVCQWTKLQATLTHSFLIVALVVWMTLAKPPPQLSSFVFGALLFTAAVWELVIRLRDEYLRKWIHDKPPKSTTDLRLAMAALVCLSLAVVVWIPSRSGGPWCFPDSIFQGHAVWHFFTSTALGLLFLYALSERNFILDETELDGDKNEEMTANKQGLEPASTGASIISEDASSASDVRPFGSPSNLDVSGEFWV